MANLRDPNIQFWSPRHVLLKLHEDLLSIDQIIYETSEEPLTTVEICVLASEDHRFFRHKGVDLRSLLREMVRSLSGRRARGASTIEMQLVRTITSRYDRTFRRKMREILLSLIIQLRYSKINMLRAYLRVAFFGSRLNGIEAASQKVFSSSSNNLDIDQATKIASMLIYPLPLESVWKIMDECFCAA